VSILVKYRLSYFYASEATEDVVVPAIKLDYNASGMHNGNQSLALIRPSFGFHGRFALSA